MEKTIKELFDQNFDFAFKATTYNNIKIALQTFEQFKMKNKDFFTFSKKDTLLGHLRTYVVEKQFNDCAFNPKSNYSVSIKQVNNYKHKALLIETNDFIISLGRTNSENELLSSSTYKKELAKANSELESQLRLDFINETPRIISNKKYAQIIYGYQHESITHLNIVIPSGDYKSIEHSKNLLQDIKLYTNYVPEDLIEESIVSLKKSLIKKAEKIV